jgi:hypothetical protein
MFYSPSLFPSPLFRNQKNVSFWHLLRIDKVRIIHDVSVSDEKTIHIKFPSFIKPKFNEEIKKMMMMKKRNINF